MEKSTDYDTSSARSFSSDKKLTYRDFISVPIFELSSDGVFTNIHNDSLTFSGRDKSELLGTSIWNYVATDDQFRTKLALSQAVKEKCSADALTFRTVAPDGTYIVYTAEVLPVYSAERHSGYYFACHDITDKYNTESELVKANKTKSEFLSKMSHEIRTPLNAIIGLTNIAMNTGDIKKMKTALSKIQTSSKHLLQIINDILDISRIEAGKLVLQREDFNFETSLANLLELMQVQADKKNITMHVDFDPKTPSHLVGDEARLSQVFLNLFSNAVKFTPDGGKVYCTIKPGKFVNGRVEIIASVRDTGIGIDRNDIERVFNSFEQADGSLARKYEGTGLGLPITRSIVELMGGEIDAISKMKVGTTFTFNVWFDYVNDRKEIKDDKRLKILIVDDNPEECTYIERMLEYSNIEVDMVYSGHEAISAISKAVQLNQRYDCVLIDYTMPEIDGIQAAEEIEKILGDNSTLVMVSVTNWSEIEGRARKVGIKKFLPKPVLPSKLIDTINSVVEKRFAIENQPAANEMPDFSEFRALIVEDVEINSEIIEFMLQPTEITLDFVKNGKEAVTLYTQNEDAFDVILMDIQMPVMDGYEATKAIRTGNTANAKTIPIVAMTANVFREDIERALNSGMNSHVGKPIYEQTLYEELSKFLTPERREQKRALKNEGIDNRIPYGIEGINVEDGLQRLRGNKELYLKLVRNMVETDLIQKIRANMKDKNYKDARLNIHSLRGFAANLGITVIQDLAGKLEQVFVKSTVSSVEDAMMDAASDDANIQLINDIENSLLEVKRLFGL